MISNEVDGKDIEVCIPSFPISTLLIILTSYIQTNAATASLPRTVLGIGFVCWTPG